MDSDSVIQRNGPATTIITPETVHIVVYGSHDVAVSGSHIPATAGGILLEGADDWTKFPHAYRHLSKDCEYTNVIARSKELGLPVYYADVHCSHWSIYLEFGFIGACFVAGVTMTGMTARWWWKKRVPPTRHRLMIAFLGVLFGVYLMLPLTVMMLRAATFDGGRWQDAIVRLQRFCETSHPEPLAFTLGARNAVMAYKQQWLADNFPERPVLVNFVGAVHSGMEELLLSSQEQKLARLKRRAGWLRRYIITPQTFHGLRVNHPDGTVETIEIPELREFWKREVEGKGQIGSMRRMNIATDWLSEPLAGQGVRSQSGSSARPSPAMEACKLDFR